MHSEDEYKNNPLHGVKLEEVLKQLVDHYGWEILYAYLNLNCFKTNPSIASSLKFMKKTGWAKDKVEAFYMYQFKSLPKADDVQFELPPRDRIVPMHQKPGEPAELSLEDAENLRIKRAKKTRERASGASNPWGNQPNTKADKKSESKPWNKSDSKPANPWGKQSESKSANKPSNKPANPWGK